MEKLADVIIDRVVEALDRPFSYRVPPSLAERVAVGQLVTVPFRSSRVAGVVRSLYSGEPGPGTREVEALRHPDPVLTPALLELAEWMSDRYLCYLAQALRAMIPAAVRRERGARPQAMWYRAVGVRRGRPSVKQEVYEYIAQHQVMDRRTVLDAFPNAGPALRALVAEEALEVLMRAPITASPHEGAHLLTHHQSDALTALLRTPGRPWLLEGVTGSGKTEVYLALIAEALAAERQSLVLLPEISLTPQIVTRFRARFGQEVAVWHSGLSQSERRSTWDAVRLGEVSVVVGARSAVFLPFPHLGVIVLDEEHEPSYKQEEHPRYHAREVALWRGQKEGATVVLGSATPSIESRHAAETGKIGYRRLPERVLGRSLPSVALVDMRQELQDGHRDIFSRKLQHALAQTLGRQEQVILFLNRRGFSTFVLCRACGQALQCPDCSVSLTYHQAQSRLNCHYCLRDFPVPSHCPECGSEKIRYFGAGTERVVAEVERLFPAARIVRADRDTLTRPQDYADLYHRFYRGDADVLVGTQMIAKGMDFPGVSLVGVVAADTALHLPDYRSAERTFQLLVQAGGRSGRGQIPGQVIIQTYNPDHYAVSLAQDHDYEHFYHEEIAFRSATRYPPFAELWLLVLEGEREADVAEKAGRAAGYLRQRWTRAEVLGPAPAPLAKVRGQYRYHILMKSFEPERNSQLGKDLKRLASEIRQLSITRDPYFLM